MTVLVSERRMWQGVLAGLAAGALWGLVFVAPRMAAGFSAADVASLRFITFGVMALVLTAWGLWRGAARPTAAQMRAALGLSVLGFTGYYTVLALAIGWAGTAVPALIIGTIPLWVMVLGKPEHLAWRQLWPGLMCTAAGLLLMMSVDLQAVSLGVSDQPHYGWGVLLALLSMLSWTAFALLNARWVQAHPEVDSAQWTNWLGVCAGLGALLIWGVLGTPLAELALQDDLGFALAVCLVTGVGSAWLASLLWTMASRRLSASLCGQLIVSETVFALVYSFAWDGQWPGLMQLLACVMFVLGILLSIKAHR
jgi:drug/metabolite transporter (DMT)-like permease